MVYGIFSGEYSDWNCEGYFNTKKEANAYCKEMNHRHGYEEYYVKVLYNLAEGKDNGCKKAYRYYNRTGEWERDKYDDEQQNENICEKERRRICDSLREGRGRTQSAENRTGRDCQVLGRKGRAMNFIKVNALDCDYKELKNPTMINLDNVCYIEKHDDASTMFVFTNGDSMSVSGPFDELVTLLEQIAKGYVRGSEAWWDGK